MNNEVLERNLPLLVNADCTVVVCSCDKYADLLESFAVLWRKYWPDCPFETMLVTGLRPRRKGEKVIS